MLMSTATRLTMNRVKDHHTKSSTLLFILCCSFGQAVKIRFNGTTAVTIGEGGSVTRKVCHDSSVPTSNNIFFSVSASPFASDLTLPRDLSIPAASGTCTTVTIRSRVFNFVREDTRTYQISLSSTSADVDENQDHFFINVLDNDITVGDSCPTPTDINSFRESCSSRFSRGSVCVFGCDSGFERLYGDTVRKCTSSLRWDGLPLFCIPVVDECSLGTHNCFSASSCANAMGSFTCTCPTGYLGDGFTCTDINECDSDNGNCPSTASCNNNVGSFTCTCPAGYYYDGTTCADIDECSPGQVHSCDTITSECMNTPGDYFCSCKPGYPGMTYFPSRGDTVTCQDCIAVVNTFCMNPGVSCDCMDESCDPDTGICSSSCTIVNICPASVESKSLSQVNPSSSVDVNCTLRGSTTVLQSLQLRLSSKLDSLDDDGITRLTGNGVNTGDKVVSTFRVESVTKEQTLFCVLLQGTYLIGGVSVKNFVHELPVLNAAPISEDVSNTSITISWRAWDPAIDDGDPPILAYIPYYRMDASDEWISGPRILTNETLQFKADNLEVDTLYEFSVAVVREGENGEGLRSPVVPLKTCCNDTSAPVYLISLIAIPVLLIALIVVSIIIRKHISKDKRPRKADDGEDNDYVNAAMADDPEDYISLEEQSRTVSSSKYEDLDHKPQGGASIPQQYFTIVPEPQKPVATPKYWTRNMKGVNSGAYEDEGVSSENRQLPNVLQSHPSGDGDKDNSYEVPDRLEEYTGVYINIKNKRKLIQPGPIKVAEFQNFMSRKKEDVVTDIVQQFMALPSGGQYSWSVALKFQNKPRNFSKFILA